MPRKTIITSDGERLDPERDYVREIARKLGNAICQSIIVANSAHKQVTEPAVFKRQADEMFESWELLADAIVDFAEYTA